jgi:hypothetical protein
LRVVTFGQGLNQVEDLGLLSYAVEFGVVNSGRGAEKDVFTDCAWLRQLVATGGEV